MGKTKDEIDEYYFLLMKNFFHNLSFRECSNDIYGETPADILHAVILKWCEYIADRMENTFTVSIFHLISHVVVVIYAD